MSSRNSNLNLPPPKVPASFSCRPAGPSDAAALSDVFFDSFNAPFWRYIMQPNQLGRSWWEDAWRMGVEDDPTARTFIVFDSVNKTEQEPEGKPVAFARWIVPQQDGDISRLWPDLLEEWDADVLNSFFGGMHESRATLMEKRPHWMLEMLGTHKDYQHRGIGAGLVKWGCDLADRDKMETYLDASERGAPFYQKHFGFEGKKHIDIPDRPAYGKFTYVSHVRPVQSLGEK